MNPVEVSGSTTINTSGYYRLTQDVSGPGTTGRKYALTCIHIRASGVTFDGMGHTIDGSLVIPKAGQRSAGVEVDNWNVQKPVTNVIIRNVTVSNWRDGFSFRGVKDLTVENSFVTNNAVGLSLYSSSDVLIKNTRFLTNSAGIAGEDVEKITLVNNRIISSKSDAIGLEGQQIQNIYLNLGDFFYVFPYHYYVTTTSGGGHVISRNEIIDSYRGIVLTRSEDNLIVNNIIKNSSRDGIRLEKVDNSAVMDNSITGYQFSGIHLYNAGYNNKISNNTFVGEGTSVNTGVYPDRIPLSVIIGTALIFLFKILTGTSNIAKRIIPTRLINKILQKAGWFEDRVRSIIRNSKMAGIFENPGSITIAGALIFGGAFAYASSAKLTLAVFCGLLIISGIVTVTPRAVQYLVAHKEGLEARYRMWWGGICVIIITMLLPLGTVFGQPVKMEITRDDVTSRKKMIISKLAAPATTTLITLGFFLLYLMKGTFASFAMFGLQMGLLTSVVMLLPTSPMEGKEIYEWNKIGWGIFFFPVLLAYFGCMIISI